MIDFREIYIAELKAVGFSASDAEEIAAWYLGAPGATPFPAHCRRVALAASGYDPSQPRNADGEWTAGGGARPREHRDKGFQDRYGNGNPETLASNPQMNVERGKAVLSHLLGKKEGDVPHAMFRKDTGWIGIDYGVAGNGKSFSGGHGLAHILAKHPGAERHLVDTLQFGKAFKHPEAQSKLIVIHEGNAAVLSKRRDGRLLITDYESASAEQLRYYKSGGIYHARGEN